MERRKGWNDGMYCSVCEASRKAALVLIVSIAESSLVKVDSLIWSYDTMYQKVSGRECGREYGRRSVWSCFVVLNSLFVSPCGKRK